jgi:hypothetical protein
MRATLAALALLLFGCGTRGDLYTSAISPLPPIATRAALVLVVPQTNRAVVVSPGQDTTSALVISGGARVAAAVPGGTQVAVLGGSVAAPVLDLVDPAAGQVTVLPLPGAFDQLTFSEDGRWAVATYAATSGGKLAARNLNEIALVDLSNWAVTRLQLDTESLAPRQVIFGPPEGDRRLVTVALERGVAVFDAHRPQLAPRRISIRPQGSQTDSTVLEALFSHDGGFLFIRATGLDDVIAVELSRGPEGIGASINFLAGGRGLRDIALPGQETIPGVVAVFAESREGWLLDPRGITDNNLTVALPEPLTAVRAMQGTHVLFHAPQARSVVAWNLADGKSGTAVLDSSAQPPYFAEAHNLAIFPHASATSAGSAALSVVTVEDDVNRLRIRIRSIALARPLTTAILGEGEGRLFFGLQERSELVSLELGTLAIHQVTLDARLAQLVRLPDGDWLGAIHPGDPLGDVTFLPAASQDRLEAIRYRGLALTGALDLPEDR